eukprot:Skav227212  [mRNA]  locus=scaffold2048:348581:348802:+ [translate_table: standard]
MFPPATPHAVGLHPLAEAWMTGANGKQNGELCKQTAADLMFLAPWVLRNSGQARKRPAHQSFQLERSSQWSPG